MVDYLRPMLNTDTFMKLFKYSKRYTENQNKIRRIKPKQLLDVVCRLKQKYRKGAKAWK